MDEYVETIMTGLEYLKDIKDNIGLDDFYINDNGINIEWSQQVYCRGCYIETNTFSSFLTWDQFLSGNAVNFINADIERQEEQAKLKEIEEKKEYEETAKIRQEQRDYEEYLKLKAKYGE